MTTRGTEKSRVQSPVPSPPSPSPSTGSGQRTREGGRDTTGSEERDLEGESWRSKSTD